MTSRPGAGNARTPFLARAESSPRLERLLNRRIFRALMHYHFVRGIRDGE